MQPKKRKIKLEMPKNPSSTYANMVIISHNKNEMFFDFVQALPHDPRARVQERIMMTPMHAKLFMQAMQKNIEKFEAQYGEIETPQRPPSLADQLFGNVQPDDGEEDNDDEQSQ